MFSQFSQHSTFYKFVKFEKFDGWNYGKPRMACYSPSIRGVYVRLHEGDVTSEMCYLVV